MATEREILEEAYDCRMGGGLQLGWEPDGRIEHTARALTVIRLVRRGLLWEAGINRFYCTPKGYEAALAPNKAP